MLILQILGAIVVLQLAVVLVRLGMIEGIVQDMLNKYRKLNEPPWHPLDEVRP